MLYAEISPCLNYTHTCSCNISMLGPLWKIQTETSWHELKIINELTHVGQVRFGCDRRMGMSTRSNPQTSKYSQTRYFGFFCLTGVIMYTDQGDIWCRRRNHCLFLQAKVKGGGYCAASRVQHSVNIAVFRLLYRPIPVKMKVGVKEHTARSLPHVKFGPNGTKGWVAAGLQWIRRCLGF